MTGLDYTGRVLDGRYRVLRKLAKGGMGTVYLGEHALVGRKVAIKVLHAELGTDEEMVSRFYREARAAAAIGHRNIIEVLDVGATPEGDPYLVMEYLEGESLGALLQRSGRLDLATIAEILGPVLRALQAAHEAGIIHRDLKPENVFLAYPKDGPPEVKVIDFGISKVKNLDKSQLTRSGAMIGTPAYMAPEQASGATSLDHRADVYAVGVIFYEMLSGRRPFEGDSHVALLAAILTTEPAPPSTLAEGVHPDAERIILKAMRRDPAERYGSAREMLADLELTVDKITGAGRLHDLASSLCNTAHAVGDLGDPDTGEPSDPVAPQMFAKMVAESTPSAWSRPVARAGRRRLLLAAVVVVAIAAAAVGLFLAFRGPDEEPIAGPAALGGPSAVTIEVQGAPDGARIFFDGALVKENPFRARRAEGVVPLRVEADGFEPYAVSVEPSKDRKIRVALEPRKVEPAAHAAPPEPGTAEPTPPEKKDAAKGKKGESGVRESGRGADYVDKFE